MSTSNLYHIVICFCIGTGMFAQSLTDKQLEKEKNKVEIYSPEEKDNIQMWFYEQTNKLGLSDEIREQYSRIISDFVFDMKRLNDKDQENSPEEIIEKVKILENKTNEKVAPLLNEAQYAQHLENFSSVIKNALEKY